MDKKWSWEWVGNGLGNGSGNGSKIGDKISVGMGRKYLWEWLWKWVGNCLGNGGKMALGIVPTPTPNHIFTFFFNNICVKA